MDNNFINQDNIDKLNLMLKSGDISRIMANIPPDVLSNISNAVNNSKNTQNQSAPSESNHNINNNKKNNNDNYNINNFDNTSIDINSIMKMKAVMEKINVSNEQRTNLLNSLKPYLREGKKEKLSQYSNIMNIAKIAELLKPDNNDNNY